MKIEEAAEKAETFMRNQYRDLEIHEYQLENLINFLVDEIGMLPPLHDLDNFPGMKDNGWES